MGPDVLFESLGSPTNDHGAANILFCMLKFFSQVLEGESGDCSLNSGTWYDEKVHGCDHR